MHSCAKASAASSSLFTDNWNVVFWTIWVLLILPRHKIQPLSRFYCSYLFVVVMRKASHSGRISISWRRFGKFMQAFTNLIESFSSRRSWGHEHRQEITHASVNILRMCLRPWGQVAEARTPLSKFKYRQPRLTVCITYGFHNMSKCNLCFLRHKTPYSIQSISHF